MKIVKFLFIFLLISCGTSKVVTDYDGDTDFSKFKTFQFYEDNGDNLNDFDLKRITTIIESKLTEMGFLAIEKPSFFIYFDTKTTESQNNNTIGIGIGNSGRNSSIGISGGIPIGGKKINEELILKFIDANNNLVWEGSLMSTIKEKRSPKEREVYLKEVIEKILQEFPPKK